MAENDNNSGRPIKASPSARPAETLVTNNNNGRIRSNDRESITESTHNIPTKTPTKTPTKKDK
jgi:hypothetical protein